MTRGGEAFWIAAPRGRLATTREGLGVERRPAVYIMASGRNGTLYVGVTSDLVRRVFAHRSGEGLRFSARYGCRTLVYFELFDDMRAAIAREKQIKAGARKKKLALIEAENSGWNDLYGSIV